MSPRPRDPVSGGLLAGCATPGDADVDAAPTGGTASTGESTDAVAERIAASG